MVRLQGTNRIDYVVLNAGILKYPNVSKLLYVITSLLTMVRGLPSCVSLILSHLDYFSPFTKTLRSFERFSDHLCTNTIGPIICAQKLLKTGIPIGTLMFMSSDSGSTSSFRAFEDGFVTSSPIVVLLPLSQRIALLPTLPRRLP